MTAGIYTHNEHLFGKCSSYLKLEGYEVFRIAGNHRAALDIAIIDWPWNLPMPTVACTLLVVLSAVEPKHPPNCLFYQKPVDLDVMLEEVVRSMQTGQKHKSPAPN